MTEHHCVDWTIALRLSKALSSLCLSRDGDSTTSPRHFVCLQFSAAFAMFFLSLYIRVTTGATQTLLTGGYKPSKNHSIALINKTSLGCCREP